MKQIGFVCVAFLLTSFVCGCGGDPLGRHAVSGSIKVDGAPLGDGTIRFEPIGGSTTGGGAAVKDGKYSLEAATGLADGKYRVSINAPVPGTGGVAPADAMPGDPIAAPKELIPPSWNMNSQQTIDVKPEGPFEFNFDVDTKKK